MEWKFKEKARDDENIDPYGEEFFTTKALATRSSALIRETIQNSLDAKANTVDPVRVRIAFFSAPEKRLRRERAKIYLEGLTQHLEAPPNSSLDIPENWDDKMDFLVIEDFGTRGLCGDTEQAEDSDPAESSDTFHNFYYFWRNTGRSDKSGESRGRWGLGKLVYPGASRIRTYFGLTVREDDGRRLLLGKSILKIHKCNGTTYQPHGNYGSFDGDCFALPEEDNSLISRFCSDFQLKRTEEPGLSIVIPFPDNEIQFKDVLEAAISQYFFPILEGNLIVEISNNKSTTILDKSSLFEILSKDNWEPTGSTRGAMLNLFNLAKWAIDIQEDDYAKISDIHRKPKWEEELFDKQTLDNLREKFKYCKKIALEVPLAIRKKDSPLEETYFHVFLERDKNLETGDSCYIRDGITITDIKSRLQKGIRGIVVIQDRPLASFLGDSENPAHTEWQERSTKFKSRYVNGPSCLKFVRDSLREIASILSGPAEERDEDLLRDIFFINLPPDEDAKDTQAKPEAKKQGKGPDHPVIDPQIQRKMQKIEITSIKDGFSINRASDLNLEGAVVTVKAAYEVRRGSTFCKYHPADFEMDKHPISIDSIGIEITDKKENRLAFRILEQDFIVTVSGFDPHRDLRIKSEVRESET